MVNRNRLLWAGFTAILAAGVGFAIRGGIFDNWGAEFGFTGSQLGNIGGAGFTGFCFGIILGGIVADKIGYGKLVIAAFLFHTVSYFVAAAANPGMSQETAYLTLLWGMFLFAFANGVLEAVANPLVATLYPENRTHYLNILHASWPGGMILGAIVGWVLDDVYKMHWKHQLALYLIPTIVYGLMFLGQKMPKSEASEKGLTLGEMFKDVGLLGGLVVCFLLALFFGTNVFSAFRMSADTASTLGYVVAGVLLVAVGVITRGSMGSFLLFALFVAHGLVGAVELGTDGWIQNITGNILTSGQGKALFIWTNIIMFTLRFCAHFIEKKLGLSPVGILLTCSILAVVGLNLTSGVNSFGLALLALAVYGIGKTFFWPTMLAVASDRFPRTGAVAISIMGGIGMLSAGLIGSPGLGYAKDRFAGEDLRRSRPDLYEQVKAPSASKFLFFQEVHGIDGKRLGEADARLKAAREELAKQGVTDPKAAYEKLSPEDRAILEANIAGDRKTLKADSVIPALMAVIYLLILLYFKSIGGYKPVTIEAQASAPTS
jgi:MFS family permease